jgi:hypothetical protein
MLNITAFTSKVGGCFVAFSQNQINPCATWKAVKKVLDPVLKAIATASLIGLCFVASSLIVLLQFVAILLVHLLIENVSKSNKGEDKKSNDYLLLLPIKSEHEIIAEVETEVVEIDDLPRLFIAPAANRQVNPLHFLGYFPGGMGGGVNYYAFRDFLRAYKPQPECLIVKYNHLEEKKWLVYNEYESYCKLPVVEPITAPQKEAIQEPKIEEKEEREVDPSPSVSSPKYSTALASFYTCWAAMHSLAIAFDAVKVSDLKAEATHIKGYRKLKKLELFLTLMENPPIDAEFSE